jgi:histidinol dehydrogenase
MKIIKYPPRESWPELIRRPAIDSKMLQSAVREILDAVKADGDTALRQFSRKYDGVRLVEIEVQKNEFNTILTDVDDDLRLAIETARENITRFHKSQVEKIRKIETSPGVICWRKNVPIGRVGL